MRFALMGWDGRGYAVEPALEELTHPNREAARKTGRSDRSEAFADTAGALSKHRKLQKVKQPLLPEKRIEYEDQGY